MRMKDESPSDRLRLALSMQREGTAMMRRNLRRRHPEVSHDEIEALLEKWLLSRAPDAPGREIPWPRKIKSMTTA